MSRITFTTRGRDTSVPGSERVRAALITGELTGRVLGLDNAAGWIRARRILPRVFFDFSLMPGVLEESPSSRFAKWANVAGAFSGEATLVVKPGPQPTMAASLAAGRRQTVPETVLNTAIALGSDGEVLLARIHGSAEHGLLVDEGDRGWLATVIADAADEGLLGDHWLPVAIHLTDLTAAPGPVLVTSSQGGGLMELGGHAIGISDIVDAHQRENAWANLEQLDAQAVWDHTVGRPHRRTRRQAVASVGSGLFPGPQLCRRVHRRRRRRCRRRMVAAAGNEAR